MTPCTAVVEVIKLIGEAFEPQKNLYVIPSTLLSFLLDYCHSFRIIVILSGLLSFLQYYCHSFHFIVIPSVLLSFLLNYCHSFWIIVIPSKSLPFQIFVLNSSCIPPIPEGWENWPADLAIFASSLKISLKMHKVFDKFL